MQIKNSFDVPLPPDEAWKVLMDVPRVAPCVPGAELIGTTDDGGYEGKVSVRLGPIALSFKGVAHIVEQDDARKYARIEAGGNDLKGRGAARAELTFNLEATDEGSRASIVTDVALTGPVAQYGRGAGVIQSVATQIVNQFSENLREMISQDGSPELTSSGGAQTGSVNGRQSENSISGFSLILSIIRQKIAGLFSRQK